MSSSAKVSVVVPCYNAAPYIAATLRSVLSQRGVTLEVIVVDDGSTDGSAEVVQREFPQVRLLCQPNRGVAAARNHGVREASHDWVAFVDADDIWLPGKLEAQWALAQASPEARLIYGAWQVWVSTDAEPAIELLNSIHARRAERALWSGPSGWIYVDLLLDCCVWTSTVLMDRALFQACGGFDESLRIGEDYDLWLRASRLTEILRLSEPCALYRHHPGGVTKAPPRANHKAEVVSRALARWGYKGPDDRQASAAAVSRNLARSWSDYAGAQLVAGQLGACRRSAWKALKLNPADSVAWTVLGKAAWYGLSAPVRRTA